MKFEETQIRCDKKKVQKMGEYFEKKGTVPLIHLSGGGAGLG